MSRPFDWLNRWFLLAVTVSGLAGLGVLIAYWPARSSDAQYPTSSASRAPDEAGNWPSSARGKSPLESPPADTSARLAKSDRGRGKGGERSSSRDEIERGPILLHDVTAPCGIAFQHTDGSTGKRYILETVASGLATFDYDLDGLIDIYFVNGAPVGASGGAAAPRNHLYRNVGNWQFVDVTDAAGVGDTRHGLGATVGDYNNDGYPDLYVSNFAENVLYRNNGDGTFEDVSAGTVIALSDPVRVGAGVCFLDIEADGDLDLFVSNYLQFSPEKSLTNQLRGREIYVGPERFPMYPNVLLRNNGDDTFTDVSEASGIARYPGYGMGITCGDFDADGATDVFVGNDGGPGNFVFFNDGHGVFEEAGMVSGVAYSGAGLAHGSMGADSGDFDNDGLLDLFVTSYQRQLATLYRNVDMRRFEDVTQQTGAGLGSFNQVTWGCGLVDLDNDGRRDIFYAAGHLIDNIDELDDSTSYAAQPVVLRNDESGRFVNVTDSSGEGLQHESVGRGACFEDFDNDGDLDVVINNSRRAPTVLRNDSPGPQHWCEVRLVGRQSNRDAVGAQVWVSAGGQRQVAEVHSGRAFQSHFGTRLHFGLGSATRIDELEIRWVGGRTEKRSDLPVDTCLVLVENATPPMPQATPGLQDTPGLQNNFGLQDNHP